MHNDIIISIFRVMSCLLTMAMISTDVQAGTEICTMNCTADFVQASDTEIGTINNGVQKLILYRLLEQKQFRHFMQ